MNGYNFPVSRPGPSRHEMRCAPSFWLPPSAASITFIFLNLSNSWIYSFRAELLQVVCGWFRSRGFWFGVGRDLRNPFVQGSELAKLLLLNGSAAHGQKPALPRLEIRTAFDGVLFVGRVEILLRGVAQLAPRRTTCPLMNLPLYSPIAPSGRRKRG